MIHGRGLIPPAAGDILLLLMACVMVTVRRGVGKEYHLRLQELGDGGHGPQARYEPSASTAINLSKLTSAAGALVIA